MCALQQFNATCRRLLGCFFLVLAISWYSGCALPPNSHWCNTPQDCLEGKDCIDHICVVLDRELESKDEPSEQPSDDAGITEEEKEQVIQSDDDPCFLEMPSLEILTPNSDEKVTGTSEIRAQLEDPSHCIAYLEGLIYYYGTDPYTEPENIVHKLERQTRMGDVFIHSWQWDTTLCANTRYSLEVSAYDSRVRSTTVAIAVYVNN